MVEVIPHEIQAGEDECVSRFAPDVVGIAERIQLCTQGIRHGCVEGVGIERFLLTGAVGGIGAQQLQTRFILRQRDNGFLFRQQLSGRIRQLFKTDRLDGFAKLRIAAAKGSVVGGTERAYTPVEGVVDLPDQRAFLEPDRQRRKSDAAIQAERHAQSSVRVRKIHVEVVERRRMVAAGQGRGTARKIIRNGCRFLIGRVVTGVWKGTIGNLLKGDVRFLPAADARSLQGRRIGETQLAAQDFGGKAERVILPAQHRDHAVFAAVAQIE